MKNFIKHLKCIKASSRCSISALMVLAGTIVSQASHATIVQFETAFGNFEVNLYDETTPVTVANFIEYIESQSYANSVIHRTVPNFVIQGGGYTFTEAWPLVAIETNPAIANEPVLSNVRGTIAMAKLGSNPDSATSQWYFNLVDNSLNLDRSNEGFTVFGEVIGDGMVIVDQIAAVSRFNLGGAFAELPLQNFDGSADPDSSNLVIISSIQIIDAATDTAAMLSPPTNIGPATEPEPTPSISGGGSMPLMLIGLLAVFGFRRSK